MNAAKVLAVTLLAGTLSIGLALSGERLFQHPDRAGPAPASGKGPLGTLPDLRLPDLLGREVASSAWAGRVVVLHFWATWCASCQRDLAALAALQKQHGTGALQVVGIAIDQPEEVAAQAATEPFAFPILLGGPEAIDIAHALGNRTDRLPFTVVFDALGRRIMSHAGEIGGDRLDASLAPLLAARP